MSGTANVEYPILRRNLKEAAWCLSDEEFQRTAWTNPAKRPPDNLFPFGEAVSFVLDEMAPDEPSGLVGELLTDEDELRGFERLVNALAAVMDRIGTHGTFSEAAGLPGWQEVRGAARALHEQLELHDAAS